MSTAQANTMWLDLKRHFEARAVEWISGLILMAWGAYLIIFPGIFAGPTRPIWLVHEALAPQEIWGFGGFVIGTIRVVALFINGKWGLTPMIRVFTSFLSVFVWFWVAVGLFKVPFPNTGVVVYSGLMLADMYSAFRAASDAYEAEAMRRLKELSETGNNVSRLSAR